MKLTVKCSLGGESGGTKELVIHNPTATLSNVRAAIAINFRLPVYGFRMVHSSIDLSCEKTLLRDSGIQDGDLITVAAKRDREEEAAESEGQQREGEESGMKETAEVAKTSTTNDAPVSAVPTSSGEAVRGEGEGQSIINDNNHNNNSDEETEEEDEEDMMEDGAAEMLSHLLATVPNLLEMRQQFLANPAEIMQQIREQDPRLFELITSNHQQFLDLVNNEALVETLQREQEEAENGLLDEEDEEGDFEYEGEAEDFINALMAEYMGSEAAAALTDGGRGGDANENMMMEVGATETQRYLDRVPTEEEEAKIEQLMQLGFTRDQCKVAFFKAKRSLERAANLLFEDPPQL
ncbi:XPC-binding domain [Trypanosoma melophagium]|uniref:XPC-binding domain n=1 Tax=Trypanosoma melophagium TaxID=715481 RepID=UPI00351A6550|nr:XPC-binding domain [Trypanosoma melophagium]